MSKRLGSRSVLIANTAIVNISRYSDYQILDIRREGGKPW